MFAQQKTLRVADLFFGAGGSSTGLIRAAERSGHNVRQAEALIGAILAA